ncbi:hypothetical protein KY290_036797 [Solanum tuberosum]|uniref:Uncharacterized protein n=1 Tax=Solanum tuberosum TaxID=4113 RepID=A0ABQ7TVD7_SOLTU|nr:hypothetical protein KY290_036797 [Solanum tuberosum]
MDESMVSEPKPCEKYSKAWVKGTVQGRWKSPRSMNPTLNLSLVKNILRQGSKEGFKDSGRVHSR